MAFEPALDHSGRCAVCGKRFHSREEGERHIEERLRKKHRGKAVVRAAIRCTDDSVVAIFQRAAGRPLSLDRAAVARQLVEPSAATPSCGAPTDDDT